MLYSKDKEVKNQQEEIKKMEGRLENPLSSHVRRLLKESLADAKAILKLLLKQ